MPTLHQQQVLPYTTSQCFALVGEVEKYPEFLPWCKAARVTRISAHEMVAELLISYKHLTERYTSRVQALPPVGEHERCEIKVQLEKGPFSHLSNHWQFIPEGAGTSIVFDLDFAFKLPLLDRLMGGFFLRANEKMIDAFKERARALYGE